MEAARAKADPSESTTAQTKERAPTVPKFTSQGATPEAVGAANEAESSKGKAHEALVQKLREVEAREQAVKKQEAKLRDASAQVLKLNRQ